MEYRLRQPQPVMRVIGTFSEDHERAIGCRFWIGESLGELRAGQARGFGGRGTQGVALG